MSSEGPMDRIRLMAPRDTVAAWAVARIEALEGEAMLLRRSLGQRQEQLDAAEARAERLRAELQMVLDEFGRIMEPSDGVKATVTPDGADELYAAIETPVVAPVCEWTDLGPEWSSACKVRFGAFASTKGRFFCPSCGKPISFKEGSE